jgi:hypothetical protein
MAKTEFFQRLEEWRKSKRRVRDVRRVGIRDDALLLRAVSVAVMYGSPHLRPEYRRLLDELEVLFGEGG